MGIKGKILWGKCGKDGEKIQQMNLFIRGEGFDK